MREAGIVDFTTIKFVFKAMGCRSACMPLQTMQICPIDNFFSTTYYFFPFFTDYFEA